MFDRDGRAPLPVKLFVTLIAIDLVWMVGQQIREMWRDE